MLLPLPGDVVKAHAYWLELSGQVRSPAKGQVVGIDKTKDGYQVTIALYGGAYLCTFRGLEEVQVEQFKHIWAGTVIGHGKSVKYAVFLRGKGDPLYLEAKPGVAVPLSTLHEEVQDALLAVC
ncbi:hypothetical protein phiFa_77 [Thermus phage phiFa]|nr:hypothetical protein phiFa_77 [Thermus phage phiFa]